MGNGGCQCDPRLDDCIAHCINFHGSHYCSCNEGYAVDTDNVTCYGEYMHERQGHGTSHLSFIERYPPVMKVQGKLTFRMSFVERLSPSFINVTIPSL